MTNSDKSSLSKRSLNIGSGVSDHCDINLDIAALEEVDVQGDMHHLPFKEGAFTRVELKHVLEHSADVIAVLEEVYRVCRDGAEIHIEVPHGFTVRGIRDPTHSQHFALRSIEHFEYEQEYLPSWYSDATFDIESARLVGGPPNPIDGKSNRFLRGILTIFNRTVARIATYNPEFFEPFVVVSSRIDIVWVLKVVKHDYETKKDI